MTKYLHALFSSDFIPHGVCMRWQSDVVLLHVLSDSAIALAYFCIPGMLYYFIRRRRDVGFHEIFLAFSLFIVCCGMTHVMDVITLWHPLYRLAGWIKALTAVVSVATAISVARLMPQLLKLPSVQQLKEANAQLTEEIRQRQNAEMKLASANHNLETALNSSQVLVWNWNTTNDSAIWCGPVEKVFGLPSTSLNGLKAVSALVHPEDRESLSARLSLAIDRGSDFDLEYRIIRPDGELRWIAGRGDTTRRHNGQAVEMAGVNYDVTENKRMAEALARSESDFRQLANAMPQIVFAATADGRIYFLNERWYQLTGLPMETVPTLAERKRVLHPDDQERWEACWRDALTSGQSYEIEYRLWDRQKQEHRWHLSRGRAIKDANGVVQRWFATSTEIHERKTATERLELEVQKRTAALSASLEQLQHSEETLLKSLDDKNVLLREVHHRVRNNLQIICSLLNMQVSIVEDEKAVTQLRHSERRVMSMALIHDQLFSREQMSSIDFSEFIRKLVARLLESTQKKDTIRCVLNLAPTILTIDQAIPCGLILNELVANALEHAYPMNGDGEITIDLSTESNCVRVTVGDLGIGLPHDFEIGAARTLGLSIIQALTSQLGGELTAENEPGATFTLHFPSETF